MISLEVTQLTQKDKVLERVIETVGTLPQISSTNDIFYDILSCIYYNQIHYRSNFKVFGKIIGLLHGETPTAENFLRIPETTFFSMPLPPGRHQTILNLVEYFQKDELTHFNWNSLTDDEVSAKLSKVKGVTSWQTDMILLFTLQRPNIFPADDAQLKQIMVPIYELGTSKTKAKMIEISETWSPHKSLAVRYLWALRDNKNRLS